MSDLVRGSPLFVSQFGSGRPLLCLHGIEAHGLRYVALAAVTEFMAALDAG